jgi:acyl-CoA synthetase (AMP-forming)/AMP-acid ligase II
MMDVNLTELLPAAGPELCVHVAGRDYSRMDIHARADQVKDALAGLGVGPGAPLGILLPNGADCVASLFGVWQAGGVVVPLNHRGTDAELRRVVRDLDLAAVITTPDQESRVPGPPLMIRQGEAVSLRAGVPGNARYEPGVAIVSFTSGTTGAPKPVPLLHARIVEGLDQVLGTLRAQPASGSAPRMPRMPNLIPVPLSLWNGIYQVLFAFRVGAPVVLMERFDTTDFQLLVRRYGIRSTVLPPAAMVMLADDERIADLAPLKYVRSISSPLSPLQARRFRDRFGISVLNGYGQTELGGEVVGWAAADSKAFGDTKLGSVGRPHAGVEIRIDDASGELLVRIPGRFDDWQPTGDVARIDDDGFVWIEGRVSDMVNRGGLKVHPAEVEEVVRLSPAVADVAVAGAPDRRLGEVPVAFIVEAAPVSDADLEALCRQHLAPYKVPVRFERVAVLPRNEVGKVLKRALVGSGPPDVDG